MGSGVGIGCGGGGSAHETSESVAVAEKFHLQSEPMVGWEDTLDS